MLHANALITSQSEAHNYFMYIISIIVKLYLSLFKQLHNYLTFKLDVNFQHRHIRNEAFQGVLVTSDIAKKKW